MGIIFDLVIVAVVIFFLITSIRKGAVRSLIEFIGSLAAIVLAVVLSGVLSNLLFDLFVRGYFLRTIGETLQSAAGQGVAGQIAAVLESLPGFIANAVDTSALIPQISGALSQSAEQASIVIVDFAIAPVIKMLMRAILVVLLYIILRLVVRLLAFTGDRIARLPVLNQLNGLCGAVLGLIKGALAVLILTAVIRVVVPMVEEPKVFTSQNIQSSYIFQYLYDKNPIFSLLEVPMN